LVKDTGLPFIVVSRLSAIRGLKKEAKIVGSTNLRFMTYGEFRTSKVIDSVIESGKCNIIFDECHELRNPSSKQTKRALKIAESTEGYRILMSGTCAPKDPSDWWCLAEIAQPGFLGAKDKQTLAFQLGDWKLNEDYGQTFYELLCWKSDKVIELNSRLSGLVTVVRKKDCLDLPPIIYETIKCEPTQDQIDVCKMVKDTAGVGNLRMKLRQIADGFYEEFIFETGKDKVLVEEFLANENLNRLVINCGFTKSVVKIMELAKINGWIVLRYDGVQKDEHLLEYMDGSSNLSTEGRVCVVAQQDASGTGTEFSATQIILNYSNRHSFNNFFWFSVAYAFYRNYCIGSCALRRCMAMFNFY
jgi:SNF2 family DNA or RNA helicase